MKRPLALPLLLSIAALAGCGGGGGGTGGTPPPPPGNGAPSVAVAKTPEAAKHAPYSSVTLDASGSSDSETPASSLTFSWTLNGAPLSSSPVVTVTENGPRIDNLVVEVCDNDAAAPRCATRSVRLEFAGCADCHGPAGSAQGAPAISAYWSTSGHGRPSITQARSGSPVTCGDCHDLGVLSTVEHSANGGGTAPSNLNSLAWPGKAADAATRPNRNTAHLKSGFLTPVADRAEVARAFDGYCFGPVSGCHFAGLGHRHAPDGSADGLVRFGNSNTTPAPKAGTWYPLAGYLADYGKPAPAGRFYATPSVWIDNDVSAFGTPDNTAYALCISCHDPHGTGTTDVSVGVMPGIGTTNHMLRGNWKSDPGTFCNVSCHHL